MGRQMGPFKVSIPCGECALTSDVIADTLQNELAGVSVQLEVREWLTEWWKPLPKEGRHAAIVMVQGRVVSQGHATKPWPAHRSRHRRPCAAFQIRRQSCVRQKQLPTLRARKESS